MESKNFVSRIFAKKGPKKKKLSELVNRFATASKVPDLMDQLLEAIPDLKVDAFVTDCSSLVIECLVSRIIDLIVATRLTKQMLPYKQVGFCTTKEADKRKELLYKVLTAE